MAIDELNQLRIEKMHKLLGTALGKSAYFLNHNEAIAMLDDIAGLLYQVKQILIKLKESQ